MHLSQSRSEREDRLINLENVNVEELILTTVRNRHCYQFDKYNKCLTEKDALEISKNIRRIFNLLPEEKRTSRLFFKLSVWTIKYHESQLKHGLRS